MSEATLVSVRKTTSQQAIVLIHGFGGDSHMTFGMLPAFLAGDPQLSGWDIYCFGYPTSLSPDISGIWAADPDLETLAGYLKTAITDAHFPNYKRLALVAHSMGGLILQRALLDGGFLDRVRHVLLFGTPSNGLRKSFLGALFKRQVRDMLWGGRFVTALRTDWTRTFNAGLPFQFRAVAGIRDEFVPVTSSVEPFAKAYHSYVAGNHLEMVKPRSAEGDTALILRRDLTADPTAPLDATSSQMTYQRKVDELWPVRTTLVEKQLVELALALEMTGAQDQAITLLEQTRGASTELAGVLAGRLKRIWLADPDMGADAGLRAFDLYKEAYRVAATKADSAQAYYNGINFAFLTLALKGSRAETRQIALDVLAHCMRAPRDKWRLATEGEAQVYLGDRDAALARYAAALEAGPDSREVDSMYRQSVWAARLLQDDALEVRLRALFERR